MRILTLSEMYPWGHRGGCVKWKAVGLLAFVIQIESLLVCASVQLDNPDEQAAQIRRELDGRLQMADQIARVRKLWGRLLEAQSPTQEAHRSLRAINR